MFLQVFILLGIVVDGLAFHAGGPGSIPRLVKLTFSPSSPSPPVTITNPPH